MNKIFKFLTIVFISLVVGCTTTPQQISKIPDAVIGEWSVIIMSGDQGTTNSTLNNSFLLSIDENGVVFPNGDINHYQKTLYDKNSDSYVVFFIEEVWVIKIDGKTIKVIVYDPGTKEEIVRFIAIKINFEGTSNKKQKPSYSEGI